MISVIVTILISLVFYYILWKIYLKLAPHIIPDTGYKWLVQPSFWQFAAALFFITFLFKKA